MSQYSLKYDTSNIVDESTLLCTYTHTHIHREKGKEVPLKTLIHPLGVHVCKSLWIDRPNYQDSVSLYRMMRLYLFAQIYSRQQLPISIPIHSQIDSSSCPPKKILEKFPYSIKYLLERWTRHIMASRFAQLYNLSSNMIWFKHAVKIKYWRRKKILGNGFHEIELKCKFNGKHHHRPKYIQFNIYITWYSNLNVYTVDSFFRPLKFFRLNRYSHTSYLFHCLSLHCFQFFFLLLWSKIEFMISIWYHLNLYICLIMMITFFHAHLIRNGMISWQSHFGVLF